MEKETMVKAVQINEELERLQGLIDHLDAEDVNQRPKAIYNALYVELTNDQVSEIATLVRGFLQVKYDKVAQEFKNL